MKHLYTVELEFFCDPANGQWGLAPKGSFDRGSGNFNAFFQPKQIFHDVWEHWFEDKLPYFKDEYAYNLAGEMVASGASVYFYEMGVKVITSLYGKQAKDFTEDFVKEGVREGYIEYGYLHTNIPRQRLPHTFSSLEAQINDYWYKVKDLPISEEYPLPSKAFKKSITHQKLKNTHFYGYKLAERMVPNNPENARALNGFIDYFSLFTKFNNAEDLEAYFYGITFTINRKGNFIHWEATLISKEGEDVKLDGKRIFDLENYKVDPYNKEYAEDN